MVTSLFSSDVASVTDVSAAINHHMTERSQAEFSADEIAAALKAMGDQNLIMYLEESDEVYKL